MSINCDLVETNSPFHYNILNSLDSFRIIQDVICFIITAVSPVYEY